MTDLLYVRKSKAGLDATGERLEAAIKAQGFGLIAQIDLRQRMQDKGVAFERPCRIYEVCDPGQAKTVLEANMAVSTALPCRIALYEEGDAVVLSTIRPTQTLQMFGSPALQPVAKDVEARIVAMMDEAAG